MLELVFFSMGFVGLVCWAIVVVDAKTDDHAGKPWFFRPGLGQMAMWIAL